MPSLEALDKFKSSFTRIGGEAGILEELELPIDDLPLPGNGTPVRAEPVPAETVQDGAVPGGSGAGESQGLDYIDFGDLGGLLGDNDQVPDLEAGDDPAGADPGGTESPPSQEDMEFGSFIDTIPDDFSLPGDGSALDTAEGSGGFDIPLDAAADSGFSLDSLPLDASLPLAEPEAGEEESADAETFDSGEALPPGLLDGLADDLETADSLETEDGVPVELDLDGLETGGDASGEPGLDGLPGFDGEAMDFSLPGEDTLPETGSPDSGGTGEADAISADAFSMDTETADAFPVDAFPADPAGDGAAPGEEAPDDGDSFDLGGELQDFDTGAVLEEIPGDPFDNFKLDAGAPAEDFDMGGETGGFGELEEFALPGIDNTGGRETAPAGGAPEAFPGDGGIEAEEPGEILLTDDEMESFQNTLASYPLNLRIACGELIAEQAVLPDQMSRLVKLLVDGAPARETAALAGKILDRTIPIPKGFEKRTGEDLETEQASFAYIFVRNFLPVLRLFLAAAVALLCTGYLGWRFIYTPIKAERIYRLGYGRIEAGEYARANSRFREAFAIHRKKSWFYEYARAFRGARQYTLAEEKYQELLYYTASGNKRGIPEKAAVLEFAAMETDSLGNYAKADQILRRNILDYYPDDGDALLALGDNSLAWGGYEPSRLEDARQAYARVMELYGRTDPLLERMLKYFIRTDNLGETLGLHSYFMASGTREISAGALAELGGYFLDKRFQKVAGVPDGDLDRISGIREILFRAIGQDSMLPEAYYHLARYYEYFENQNDEKITLDLAVKVFEAAEEESPRRISYHVNTLRRHGEVLTGLGEFFAAEESLVKGVNLYEDALSRRLLPRSPESGRLYTDLGDLEYFVKDGDMQTALDYYRLGEEHGWAPPEIQYRMGAAHYQLREWGPALERLFAAHREMTPNRRILYALGNVSYMRGNYSAAQGYYGRLLEILNGDRERLPAVIPPGDGTHMDLAERLMVAQNNLGVTLEALAARTGSNSYRSTALGLYADSERAWDVLTRDPQSMLRMRPSPEISAPGVNPAYLNVQNSLHPVPGYEPHFFIRIDKDAAEPSVWEDIAPAGYRLSEGIYTGR